MIVSIVSVILAPKPVLVAIPLNMRQYNLQYNATDGDRAISMDAFVFSITKSITIIVWFFVSNYFIKQRKVTTVYKVRRWFYVEIILWLIFYGL